MSIDLPMFCKDVKYAIRDVAINRYKAWSVKRPLESDENSDYSPVAESEKPVIRHGVVWRNRTRSRRYTLSKEVMCRANWESAGVKEREVENDHALLLCPRRTITWHI